MTQKILTFSDIRTGDVLYYDKSFKKSFLDRCYRFCEKREIDFLPALEKTDKMYFRDPQSETFKERYISGEMRVEADMDIFSEAVGQKFRKNPLLFVMNKGKLDGVVHFSDYNRPVVSIYLYELIVDYERKLRTVLIGAEKNNEHMLKYFEHKAAKEKDPQDKNFYKDKITYYEKNKTKISKLQEFEFFYLKELISFVNHLKLLKLGELDKLRNAVMHASDFVNMQDPKSESFIYDVKTFEAFWKSALQLHHDRKVVTNYLAFASMKE